MKKILVALLMVLMVAGTVMAADHLKSASPFQQRITDGQVESTGGHRRQSTIGRYWTRMLSFSSLLPLLQQSRLDTLRTSWSRESMPSSSLRMIPLL